MKFYGQKKRSFVNQVAFCSAVQRHSKICKGNPHDMRVSITE